MLVVVVVRRLKNEIVRTTARRIRKMLVRRDSMSVMVVVSSL
jgi:hypothetical protein